MISKASQLDQIHRFFNLLEDTERDINQDGGPTNGEIELNALRRFHALTSKIWPQIDEHIVDIKQILDEFEETQAP